VRQKCHFRRALAAIADFHAELGPASRHFLRARQYGHSGTGFAFLLSNGKAIAIFGQSRFFRWRRVHQCAIGEQRGSYCRLDATIDEAIYVQTSGYLETDHTFDVFGHTGDCRL